ncbi:enoyl-CoA hydratase [Segetibacter sp. 3557_3]|uniref:enoyl-CoA hydratase/isomerase family protein n=1 Tax=Segetibacter sp. 3557_3 TaxID=2547429 RepID=UPI001058D669|nr:enoyl-CoA hydratase-related protein [Segetibacter sp. 3557_3]TDH26080.1 enoyl-CoA hydratase [Segetibacter sp. 3557_3]
MYETLLTSLKENILTITINRPTKLNAVNRQVMHELGLVVEEVYNDPSVRSVLLTGAGDKAFVAGADISEFMGLSVEDGKAVARTGQELFMKIERSPKPIVAAVNGFALGGGCELAMACHFRVASENARFGQPEVNLGLIPGYGGTQRLVQLIGKGRALEMMLTGNMITAGVALQYGLVNAVVKSEELIANARALLVTINSKAPRALSMCIEAANAVFDESSNGYEAELNSFGACFGTKDMQEGTAAFLEKRKPLFTGN